METDFIYWSHRLPQGITVEEISGGEDKSDRLWRAMALQLYSEHGADGEYRMVDHYASGAPLLEGHDTLRVSLTHTRHFMAIASMPVSQRPEDRYMPGEGLGIDAERTDREQVVRIRERFMNAAELEQVAPDDVEMHILAWTVKEAVYKAALTAGLDFRASIRIREWPGVGDRRRGLAEADLEGHGTVRFNLYSWISEGCCVTVAASAKQ